MLLPPLKLWPTPLSLLQVIVKENNFKQAGERWRSFDPARRDRFIERLAGMLLDPR